MRRKCQGRACGACDGEDLKLRAALSAADSDTDLARVKVIDQSSVVLKIRARLEVPPENRFVTREHWKYAVRRAAYRAHMTWTGRRGSPRRPSSLPLMRASTGTGPAAPTTPSSA